MTRKTGWCASRKPGPNFMLVKFGYAADGTRLWKWINQNPTNLQVWIGNIYEEKGGKMSVPCICRRPTSLHV